ncbi:hypothetical protein [Wenyingzhuangia sp. IMCC45467]
MKKNTILSKKIIREINKSNNNFESKLNIDFLNNEKYYNYEIEEWYGAEFNIKGELRKLVIETLLKTYFEWKHELDKLNKDYYLAIWLYNPRMLKSEVVCAIEEKIPYYENEAFLNSKKKNEFNLNLSENLSTELQHFTWNRKTDMDSIHEWEINFPKEEYQHKEQYYKDQKLYKRVIQKEFYVAVVDNEKIYFYPKGDVWIGKMK